MIDSIELRKLLVSLRLAKTPLAETAHDMVEHLLEDLKRVENLAVDLRDRMNRDVMTDVLYERFEDMVDRSKRRQGY